MIEQIVTWPYLRTRAEWLIGQMAEEEGRAPEAELPDEARDLDGSDFDKAAKALGAALELPMEEHLGDADRSGGAGYEPLETRALVSRDQATSILQSALELYFDEQRPGLIEVDKRAGRGAAPGEIAPVTNLSLSIAPDTARGLARQFEITDPGWINSLIAMGWRHFKKPHDFVDRPAEPRLFAENARVVLVADWGSGTPRARRVADEIRKVIEPDIGRREQHLIHLGDVYYSGWKREYQKRFLEPWPVNPGEPVGSWCLTGNHDMYSGGHAYFDYMLLDPRFDRQQGSSWFSLENDHWQLLGLDTSWEDHALKQPQGAWVERKLRENPARSTMLLSHHQPLSAYGHDGPKLRAALAEPLDSGHITSWFWGHEHRCVLYEQGAGGIGWARLIGHGGIPEYAHNEPLTPPAAYQYTDSFDAGIEKWSIFGFAVLEFDRSHITARYINEYGGEHKTEDIGGV